MKRQSKTTIKTLLFSTLIAASSAWAQGMIQTDRVTMQEVDPSNNRCHRENGTY